MWVHARQTRGRDQIRLTLLCFGIANGPECEAITIDRGNVCFLEVRRSGYAHLLVSRQREDRRFPRSSLLFRLLFTLRSEEHTSELQSLMRISSAVFCLNKKTHTSDNRVRKKLTY